jgi:hypothetical protein
VKALPTCERRVPLEPTAPEGVRYVTDARPEFVVPPFHIDQQALESAQAVVIAAPAAVGKSMLAEYLAFLSGGVLWDLSRARVGNNYAVGTLAASHGARALGEVLAAIWAGQFLVVADALDEARLRVTFDAFTAFLDDLATQVLKGIEAGAPAVVLLARSESADFAAEWLRDVDVAVATAEIDFFDRPGAVQFVRSQIEVSGADPDNAAMAEAQRTIFARTLDLLGVDPDEPEWPLEPARRFLGYAPVLVATARYLFRGGNPQRIAEDLKGRTGPSVMWQFLLQLLNDMLAREQRKFVDGFRERHGDEAAAAGFGEWGRLFTPEEQCDWLVSETLDTKPPEVFAPAALHHEYQAEVRGWMPEHPFVGPSTREFASPVFSEYVYARALREGTAEARAAVRARVADASYRPTEMLARFFFELGEDGVLTPDDLAVLYESVIAADDVGHRVSLDVVALEEEGRHLAFFEIGDDDPVRLEVQAGEEPLQFFTRLSRARIVSDGRIQLGSHGRLVELGPGVIIFAPAVDVLAESIGVRSDADPVGILINTGRLTGVDHAVRFVYGEDRFGVQAAEPLRHPFAARAVRMRLERKGPLLPAERSVANGLFRLAAMFKTEGYEGLGSYAEPIDRIAAHNESFRRVLEAATEREIVIKTGRLYRFFPEKLGLDFAAVQTHDLSDDALAFVRYVAGTEPPG